MNSSVRTELQADSDLIDCDLRRLQDRIERLAETFEKREGRPAYDLNGAAASVRHARSLVRQCMHKDDIKATPY